MCSAESVGTGICDFGVVCVCVCVCGLLVVLHGPFVALGAVRGMNLRLCAPMSGDDNGASLCVQQRRQ